MATDRQAYVHEARVQLASGVVLASVGAAVAIELCGRWEHPDACRWPDPAHRLGRT